ncbi:MAG: efflux RND transporter periplasmic adaptor subunit [Myxococcaceae bacterium]
MALGSGCSRRGGSASADAGVALLLSPENVTLVERTIVEAGPTLSGNLQPMRQAALKAQAAGEVLELTAERGQKVHQGQLLARIDDRGAKDAYRAALTSLNAARSALALAESEIRRSKTLREKDAISSRELETAAGLFASRKADLAGAYTRLTIARRAAEDTSVIAPFDGEVAERAVNLGDVVQQGAPMLTVVDRSSLRLDASVPATEASALKVGSAVEFHVQGQGDRAFTGRVQWLSPQVNPQTRQVELYVDIPNPGGALLANLYAEGRVAVQRKQALTVDAAAVKTVDRDSFVLVIRRDRVERVPVQLGLRDDVAERVEILSGLAEGDVVIAGNAPQVVDGSRVHVDHPVSSRTARRPTSR